MKQTLFFIFFSAIICLKAQTKEYIGKWALCKMVTPAGDTLKIKPSDTKYTTYEFLYNNTFTSFIKEKNEAVTGRWGFEFKTKTIKIKNPILAKTKKAIGDYGLVIARVTATYFVEMREEGKKKFAYYIYCKTE